MGTLLTDTWYNLKYHLAGGQAMRWDIQKKATSTSHAWLSFVLNVPERSLPSSMADFVPCDRGLLVDVTGERNIKKLLFG